MMNNFQEENCPKCLRCCPVTKSCLQPHGRQHAILPCVSPPPGVCSNSCPSSWRRHPTVSPSVVPFSFCLQPFPTSGSFPKSRLFASGGQSVGASASASVLLTNIQARLVSFPCSTSDSQESSPAPWFESISSLVLCLLYGPTLTSVRGYWKNYSFDYTDLCWQSDASRLICCLGLSQLPFMDTALLWWKGLHMLVKLWAMPCRAIKDRLVIVESSEKTRATGGGNGEPLQPSCHENPVNSIARLSDLHNRKSWYTKTVGDVETIVDSPPRGSKPSVLACFYNVFKKRITAIPHKGFQSQAKMEHCPTYKIKPGTQTG